MNGQLDRRQRRTRAALHAALERLVDRTPYHTLNVSLVADAADIGRPTFYRHFDDVHGLLIDRLLGDLDDQLALARRLAAEGMVAEELLTAVTLFALDLIAAHPRLYRPLLDGSAGANAVTLFRDQIAQLVAILPGTPEAPEGGAASLQIGTVAGAISGFLLTWIEGGMQPAPGEATAQMVRMIGPLMTGDAAAPRAQAGSRSV